MLIDGLRLRKRLSNEGWKLEIELEGSTLEQVENVKLLGLELDEELSFDIHIDSMWEDIEAYWYTQQNQGLSSKSRAYTLL